MEETSKYKPLSGPSQCICAQGLAVPNARVPVRGSGQHHMTIQNSACIHHGEAPSLESGLLRGRFPRSGMKVKDRFEWLHAQAPERDTGVTARDAFKSVANEEHGYGAPIPAKSKAALPAIFANHLSTRRFNIRKTMRSTDRATVKLATILTPRVITTDTSGERSTAVDTWFLRLSTSQPMAREMSVTLETSRGAGGGVSGTPAIGL